MFVSQNSQHLAAEIKFDGIRLIASHKNNRFILYTRHGNIVNATFPEITPDIIEDGTVVDGELVVLDKSSGKPTDGRCYSVQYKTLENADDI